MAVYSFTWGSFQSKVNELCLKLADKQQLIICIRIYWGGLLLLLVAYRYETLRRRAICLSFLSYHIWVLKVLLLNFFLLAQMVNEEYQTWKREKYICIIVYVCVFSAKEEFPNKWVCLEHSWSLFILFILGWKCVLCY